MPIPPELREKPDSELRTIAEGAVVECRGITASAKEFWFGGQRDNLCLFSAEYARTESAIYPIKAAVPRGTVYTVKRRDYWNGIDADRYFLEIRVPSITGDTPVILLDDFSEKLIGIRIGSKK
jgi:hypothetical protein